MVFKGLKPLIKSDLASLDILRRNLGELYALILASHPEYPAKFKLNITVQGQPVTGTYAYRWTEYSDAATDLRPRRYAFNGKVSLPFVANQNQKEQDVRFVLELGVKQDTGCATEGITRSDLFDATDDWGIDVYGNGRLIQPIRR